MGSHVSPTSTQAARPIFPWRLPLPPIPDVVAIEKREVGNATISVVQDISADDGPVRDILRSAVQNVKLVESAFHRNTREGEESAAFEREENVRLLFYRPRLPTPEGQI